MARDGRVIFSVDISGSVNNCRDYYAHIQSMLDEIQPKLGDLPVIVWSSKAEAMPLDEFISEYVEPLGGDGGTHPSQMVAAIEEAVERHKVESFELVLTTDGEIDHSETEVYCDRMKKSKFFDKITNVRAYFIGPPEAMNTNITHAFENIPLSMSINDHTVVPKKKVELTNDEPLANFKMENVPSLVDDLAIQLSVLPGTLENRTAIRRLLDQIKGKCLIERFAEPGEEKLRDPAQVTHDFLAERNTEELKKYYLDLLAKQKDDTTDKKINKLYSLLNKDHVQCSDLMCFIPEFMDTEAVKKQLDDIPSDDEVDPQHNVLSRQKFCAKYYIESTLPVIQLHNVPATSILKDGKLTPWKDRKKLSQCPLQLFEHINVEKLNDALLRDHMSVDTFVDLFKNEKSYSNNYTFKSACGKEVYGIMLYDFPNSTETDLYLDEDFELYKEKTQLDKNIVNHICCIISHYILRSREMKGSRGLWAISFLYLLYSTAKVQEDEYLKRCIRYTIIRISLVFKCNVNLFKGVQPLVSLPIHDALLCSLHVSSTMFHSDRNITRRLDESGPIFIQMMQEIFVQDIPKEICFDDWFSWKYLYTVSKDVERRHALESIIKTKVQDWIDTKYGPLILEGKTNDAAYNAVIKKSSIDVLYKMVQILKDTNVKATKGSNYSHFKVSLPADIARTKVRSPTFLDVHQHVKICKSTCRPTYLCRRTGRPWYKCVPETFRESHVSFYNLYGKYTQTAKRFPTAQQFMAFLAKKYPTKIYYRNTAEVLSTVIEQFNALDLDPKTFTERHKSSALADRRIKMEAACGCPAHPRRLKFRICVTSMRLSMFLVLFCIIVSVCMFLV